ncbi:metal ion transmembrane transporter [Ascochyta rabiei]|uniref:Metal ion transmembrane transporter n=1 Tax=Didymella rabiei TaxID=5454 RepID=A0A163H389_DIDRA|nr:metal ion transmembrane transporter [Ascochyta rabiei]
MHDAARHAIHSFETLTVTVETAEAMQQQVAYLADKSKQLSGSEPKTWLQVRMRMELQVRMFHNLLLRSQANKERLQNEIALAYNMIAQRDSQVMAGLGEAAKLDSGAMKTIAIVTMAFIPPTFLSAIFSMSFFSYNPELGGAGWSVSSKFWVYWVCAIPLTSLTLAIWYWRQRRVGS